MDALTVARLKCKKSLPKEYFANPYGLQDVRELTDIINFCARYRENPKYRKSARRAAASYRQATI